MLLKKPDDIKSSEITDETHYLNRRDFIRGGALVASLVATGGLYRALTSPGREAAPAATPPPAPVAEFPRTWDVPNDPETTYEDITHYNNFYEFSTAKREVANVADGFVTRPWTVAVEGLAAKPGVYDVDDLLKRFPAEERVYRHRCVEAWSMVIPWLGFPLASLLKLVEPLSAARYVEFVTLLDPKRMPGQRYAVLDWPYVEGLRIDEAMHPLAFISTGIYGRALLPQNGAPLRLVVPWKYGFKSIKSIVTVRLVAEQPTTAWNAAAPDEYGFYSNVNPEVDHPRWSQKRERRIGEYGMRPTLPFNGYYEQVAGLYKDLDLTTNF